MSDPVMSGVGDNLAVEIARIEKTINQYYDLLWQMKRDYVMYGGPVSAAKQAEHAERVRAQRQEAAA